MDMGYFYGFMSTLYTHTHCALIGRPRVIECECWKEDKIPEGNKVRTFYIDWVTTMSPGV